jgi:hypothetical protein
MYTHARRLTAAGVALALGLTLVAGDGGRAANVPRPISDQMVLVRIEPDELTRYLHKLIQDELKAPAPDERAMMKVRGTALLIAARAQNGLGARDVWQRTALRDNALKLQKALAEGKCDTGRKRAALLFDMAGASADTRPVPLTGLMELDEVESLMKGRLRGGIGTGPPAPGNRDGIEIRIMMLARKTPTPAEMDADAEDIARAAAITAAMANLLDAYTPEKKIGNKDPNDWKIHLGEMRAASHRLEVAAKEKDVNGVKAAAIKLHASCSDCHGVFRD